MNKIIARVTLAVALTAASAASAQEVDTLCRVEWTRPDGSQVDMLRQYEIDDARGIVNVYDDQGQGWVRTLEIKSARLETMRLVLAEVPGMYHELNRVTGMMFSITRHQDGSFERKRGICNRSNKLSFQ
jgi:hypothetical protein